MSTYNPEILARHTEKENKQAIAKYRAAQETYSKDMTSWLVKVIGVATALIIIGALLFSRIF